MKKLSLLLLLALPLHAAVVMTINKPTGAAGSNYGWVVLPGSQRQISTHLTGGTTWKVNWSILSTTGGATATLDRSTNAVQVVNVTIGSVGATCGQPTGSVGSYVVSSAATVTVQAQSVDDTSQVDTATFKVCNPPADVHVTPAYQQSYPGQPAQIQSFVPGKVDESGTWSILSQPSGGDATLPDTNKRDAIPTATVAGRYSYKFTSAADSSKSATAIVYVTPVSVPAYGMTTKNLTLSVPCEVDPAMTGPVIDIGPTQAVTTMNAAGFETGLAGTTYRLHNEDTTGTNPTRYHENVRVKGVSGTSTDGTPTQPKYICGVPDSQGNLPVMDGSNATANVNMNGLQAYGILSIWLSSKSSYDYWSGGSDGTDFITVAGIHIQNANGNFNYIDYTTHNPAAYGNFSSCLNLRGGTNIAMIGNELDHCGLGIFGANNSTRGWGGVTLFNTIRGNYFHDNSTANDFGAHHVYTASWYTVIEGNRFGDLTVGSGSCLIKDRGIESIHRYNLGQSAVGGFAICMESATDAEEYVTLEAHLGATGDSSCQNNYCGGENTITIDQIAAYQESLEKNWMYGNIYSTRNVSLATMKLSDSAGAGTGLFHNETEMGDHLGVTYYYYNTVDNPMLAVFATLQGTNNGGTPQQQTMKPSVFAANNIFYKANTGSINIFAFSRNASIVAKWQTNLMNKNTFDNTTPIWGLPSLDVAAVNGWQNYTDDLQYDSDGITYSGGTPTISIDTHQTGLSSGNFLSTPVMNQMPYNTFTYAPVVGGGAIGTATTITEPYANLLPVRFQYSAELSRVIPRTTLTTIGAVDTGSFPTIAKIDEFSATKTYLEVTFPAIMGGTYTLVPVQLVCTSTNGLSKDCSPDLTWKSIATDGSPTTSLTFYANNDFLPTTFTPMSGYVKGTYPGLSVQAIYPYAFQGLSVPPQATPPSNRGWRGFQGIHR